MARTVRDGFSGFARAALALGALALVVFGVHAPRLGLYLDDWFLFEALLGGGGWWERVAALSKTGFAPRTLNVVFFPTVFQFAGDRPAAWHAYLAAQDWALACVWFALLRRWLGSERLALSAAALGLLYPVSPATHHWLTSAPQAGALLLVFASLLAHLDWLERRKPASLALALGLYAASLLHYEAGAFLIGLQALVVARRAGARAAARDVVAPYAAVLLAALLWQRHGGSWLTGAPHPKTLGLSATRLLGSYAEALRVLGPDAWGLAARSFAPWRAAFSVEAQALLAACIAGAAWGVSRAGPQQDAAPALRPAAALGGAMLVAAYLPFALTGKYPANIAGLMSRTNAAGALAAGLLLAVALEAAAVAGRRAGLPRAGRVARAAGLAVLLAACAWTDWVVAGQWAAAGNLQKELLAKVGARARDTPKAGVVLLANAPAQLAGVEVFTEHWGFSSALRLASGRRDVGGMVLKPCMRPEARGVADYCADPPGITPYGALYIYDAASDRLLQLAAPRR